ncbi:hypothetical protein [Planctellipticum variicoloris]|uniref:hypothetical protein n=1 Tax=Planctellipticum variicoloris TaxID=3064265 RepID=UPI0030135424|nr:hypothetical protein SH412_003717 [Planctomycetaceae bacterium SH412]
MAVSDKAFNAIVERCWLALQLKFQHGTESRARPLLDAEFRLIEQRGFQEALVEIVEFADRIHKQKAVFHAIGAGGSSVILFLLGFSDVDPVRYRTHFQRLWCTSNGEPPTVQFVVLPADGKPWDDIPRPLCVTVHSMTSLEAIPEILRRQLPDVTVRRSEKAVFAAIQSGDTDEVFQLDSEPVRSRLSQIRPSGIRALATATAVEQISLSHPEIAETCIAGRGEEPTLPILFQETIMERLHRQGRVPWNETYRFVQAAAKGRASHVDAMKSGFDLQVDQEHAAEDGALPDQLAEASRWAVCRAHHVANAITSYRAAYYRTFHRQAFENALQRVSDWDRAN